MRPPLNRGGGNVARHAARDERVGNIRECSYAHVEDDGAAGFGECRPVGLCVRLGRIFVAGHEGYRRRETTVSHRNSRVGWRSDSRRYARNYLE